MIEEAKTKQEEDHFRYFYKDEKSKGKYLAPIVHALRNGEKISKEQEKILLEDFKEFEIPLLPAKTVERPEGSVALRYYFEMAHIPTKLGESKHYNDVIGSAFTIVYLHLRGMDRNGNKDDKPESVGDKCDKIGEKYDEQFDKYNKKIDLEAWKKGILKDSEKEAADALEEKIERLLVGALAEEIAGSLTPSASEKELVHVSAQKNEEDEPVADEWGAIDKKLEERDDNLQQTYLEEQEFEDLCKQFSDHMTEQVFDFVERKDGRGGEIKRFYKRDERYKIYMQEKKNKWVEDILANERLKEEGDYAINLTLFFTWEKNNARTKDGGIYSLEKYIGYVKSKGGSEQNVSTENDHNNNIFLKTVEIFLKKWRDNFQDADDYEKELLKDLVENALHEMKVKYSMKNFKMVLQKADSNKFEEILTVLINNLLGHMDDGRRKELGVKKLSIDELRLIEEIFMEKTPENKEEELEKKVKRFLENLLKEIQNAEHDKCEAIIKKLMPEIERADSDKHEMIYQLFFGKSEDDKVTDEQGLQEINNDLDNLKLKSEGRKKYYKELKGKYNAMLTFFYYTLAEQFKERKPEIILCEERKS